MSAPTEPSVTAEENAKRLATIACEIARLYAIDEKYALDMLLRGREATRAAELAAERR